MCIGGGGWDPVLFPPPPPGPIDFQATYELFVCTDTLECKLVKCELHHLSPAGPRLIFLGLIGTGKHAHIRPGWIVAILQTGQGLQRWVGGHKTDEIGRSAACRSSSGPSDTQSGTFIFIPMQRCDVRTVSGLQVYCRRGKSTSQDLMYGLKCTSFKLSEYTLSFVI